jgi:hypothetical protein
MTAGAGPIPPGTATDPRATDRRAWGRRDAVALGVGLVLAIVLRVVLLPAEGLRQDMDTFAGWVHALATDVPLGQAYRLDLSFPPIMVYLFWALARLVPAFATSPDAGDLAVRIALKVPASLADLGLAFGIAYLLRERPGRAVVGALLVAGLPITWYVSAWWGQFESIYVLLGLVAAILVLADRPWLAAIALGLALMTKPQALPFLVPFGAYVIGRYGWRRAAVIGAVTAMVAAVTWLPFLADGGPSRYAANLASYQYGSYAVLSLRAWNLWWLIQEPLAGGNMLADNGALLGPITPRLLGYAMAGLAELAVFLLVLRRPTREGLLRGLAASALVAFSLLTTMHERYSYGAVIILLPVALVAARRERAAWLALAIAVTANLLAAIPPSGPSGGVIPLGGVVGIAGSIVILGVTSVALLALVRPGAAAGGAP